MKISIQAPEADRVAIVGEIVVGQTTLLEGYNGVGKSTLIRILQACLGHIPYAGNMRAWDSLRESLGSTEVQIDDLHNSDRIRWKFDTRGWVNRAGSPTDDWFDVIEINGVASSLDAVRSKIAIYRLSGDQDIVESFANSVEANRASVETAIAHLEDASESPWPDATDLLDELIELTGIASFDQLATDERLVADARDEVSKAESELGDCDSRIAAIDSLISTQLELDELRDAEPRMRSRLAQISAELPPAETGRNSILKALQARASAAALGEGEKTAVANAERNYSRNMGHLSDAELELSELLATLGLAADASDLDAALDAEMSELAELTNARDAIDRVPAVTELVRKLRLDVAKAVAADLATERVLPVAYTRDPSATSLHAALNVRQDELLTETHAQATELDVRIEEAAKKLAMLRSVPRAIATADRYRKLADKHQSRLTELASSEYLAASQEYEQLKKSLVDADNDLLRLQTEQARLVRQLSLLGGGSDFAILTARVEQLRSSLPLADGIEPFELRGDTLAQRDVLAARAQVALQSLEDAIRTRDSRLGAIESARAALATSDQFAWVRAASPEFVPALDELPERSALKMSSLFQRAQTANDVAQQYRNDLISVSQALDTIAKRLRGQEQTADAFVGELRNWFETQFSAYFDSPAVRSVMLPESASEVQVNLELGRVVWREGTATQSRVFDAFSSGQQAFAYARAQLGIIDAEENQSRTRLICLDEFGAFLSADRRIELVEYLHERSKQFENDHVLLVLPVRIDYQDAASSALGADRERFSAIDEQLRANGYFFEEL